MGQWGGQGGWDTRVAMVVGRAHCVAAPFGVLKTRCTYLTPYNERQRLVYSRLAL